ncbi:MAG: response regulator [Planctomycetota bacterium]
MAETEKQATRVFLADDHVMVREGLAALVGREPDIEVIGQEGQGLSVVECVLECRPDVVVLDIMMPGINGLDICRELTRKAKKTAILILTMYDDEQFIVRALEYGASGYLLKEAAGDKLATAVRTVARGELYLGPGIPKHVVGCIGRGGADPYERLTTRERQVLQLIAEGKTNRQVAEELNLAVKTVDTHRSHLMRKLDIHDQTSLVKFAIRKGIVSAR